METIEIKADLSIDDAGTISGIAWPFGSPDITGDVIEKGAIRLPDALPIVIEHDQKQVVGVWESATETDAGLEVKGRLFVEGIGPAREAHTNLRKGRVSGLSIGFKGNRFDPLPNGGRKFTDLTITEISLCRRPVHPGARITAVKAQPPAKELSPMEPAENTDDAADEFKAVNDNVTKLTARLDKMEAKLNRPAIVANDENESDFSRKAFMAFARKGIERATPDEVKALTVANDANGGYLAPEAFGDEILKKTLEFSPIRQYARVVTIGSAEIKYPRRVSGTTAASVSEIAARTASQPVFEQVTLTPHELATYTDVSNALLEDNAYNLEAELAADFGESFGLAEGTAFVAGTGTGQPKGLLTATGIAEVKTGVAAAFPSSNPADVLIGMYHKLPTVHAQSGVWIMNRTTLGIVRTWKDSTGRYLVLDPISEGAPSTLLGRPIVEAVDMPDIAAGEFPILFGDLSGYRIVDRVSLTVLRDPYTIATTGQVRFHARKRVGADVTHPDRFVKLKVAA